MTHHLLLRGAGWLALALGLLYGGLCVVLFVVQRSMIYFPQPSALRGAASRMMLGAGNAQLQVSVRPLTTTKALIYFGGNGEDVSGNLSTFESAFPDRALYLLHYRGYGDSTGSPSESNLYADARLLFDHVHSKHTQIAVMGRSLGSGVAVRLASERPVSTLILVTPYNSIEEIAARQFPFFPIKWLLTDKFESWRYAPRVQAPTLILVADGDEVIPRDSSDRLFAAFSPGTASLTMIRHTGHNTISDQPEYLAAIQGALQ